MTEIVKVPKAEIKRAIKLLEKSEQDILELQTENAFLKMRLRELGREDLINPEKRVDGNDDQPESLASKLTQWRKRHPIPEGVTLEFRMSDREDLKGPKGD